jgi:hypothetical protein
MVALLEEIRGREPKYSVTPDSNEAEFTTPDASISYDDGSGNRVDDPQLGLKDPNISDVLGGTSVTHGGRTPADRFNLAELQEELTELQFSLGHDPRKTARINQLKAQIAALNRRADQFPSDEPPGAEVKYRPFDDGTGIEPLTEDEFNQIRYDQSRSIDLSTDPETAEFNQIDKIIYKDRPDLQPGILDTTLDSQFSFTDTPAPSVSRDPYGPGRPPSKGPTRPTATYNLYPDPVVFSGCDIIPIAVAGGKVVNLGNLTGLSYSIHRGKNPVRVLGRSYPKSISRGGRTIAGSLVSLIFNQAALAELGQIYPSELASDTPMTSLVIDQLPPFDITVTYWSETPGRNGEFRGSYLRLYGVEIVDEGQSHTTQDAYPENIMQFVARDIEMMIPIEDIHLDGQGRMINARPFDRAIFQAGTTTSSVQNMQTASAGLSTTIADIQHDINFTESAISTIDRHGIIFDIIPYKTIPPLKGPGLTNLSENEAWRDVLWDTLDTLRQNLKQQEQQRDSLNAKAEKRQSLNEYKAITNPYESIRDNPFDIATPVRY